MAGVTVSLDLKVCVLDALNDIKDFIEVSGAIRAGARRDADAADAPS